MLPKSKIFSFIDSTRRFTIQFLEGQNLIKDLVLINAIQGEGLQYFRDSILTSAQLIYFLRPGEQLGLYIDNENPYFRLKFELAHNGQMRTLLLPENFNLFPKTLEGRCRLVKISANNLNPYTSIISLDKINFHEVINSILKDSYQISASIFVSDLSDQSILINKLPPIKMDFGHQDDILSVAEYWKQNEHQFRPIFESGLSDETAVVDAFNLLDFSFLGSRTVEFFCPCNYQTMVEGVLSLVKSEGIQSVFGKIESLDAKCDFCKRNYQIDKKAIKALADGIQ